MPFYYKWFLGLKIWHFIWKRPINDLKCHVLVIWVLWQSKNILPNPPFSEPDTEHNLIPENTILWDKFVHQKFWSKNKVNWFGKYSYQLVWPSWRPLGDCMLLSTCNSWKLKLWLKCNWKKCDWVMRFSTLSCCNFLLLKELDRFLRFRIWLWKPLYLKYAMWMNSIIGKSSQRRKLQQPAQTNFRG